MDVARYKGRLNHDQSLLLYIHTASDRTMAHNNLVDMSFTSVPHHAAYSREEEALGWGNIMYQRFWIAQTPPVKTIVNDQGISVKYIPGHYLRGLQNEGRATLVRPEYEECWARLKSDMVQKLMDGLLIWGSSGAGKSISLLYLLLQCLRSKMPVAMSFIEGYHILFDEQGVSVHKNYFADASSTIVILQDAFSRNPVPYDLYRRGALTYVVLATSPQICRYKSFVKDCSPDMFVMPPWRREELEALLLLDPGASSATEGMYSALEVYDYLGPSLKMALKAKIPKSGDVDADLHRLTTRLRSMLAQRPAEHWIRRDSGIVEWIEADNPPVGYHTMFSIYPSTSPGDPWRFASPAAYVVKIPTTFLATLFFSLVADRSLKDQLLWASKFTAAPAVRGALFETLGIVYLSYATKPSRVFFRDQVEGDLIPPRLRRATHVLRLDSVPEAGLLHIAKIGAAAIDAIWEDPGSGIVYLMNMTVAARHPISAEGIRQAISAYGGKKTAKDFVFLFVVPSTEIGESVVAPHGNGFIHARGKLGRAGAASKASAEIPVGYIVIDVPRIQHLDTCLTLELSGVKPFEPPHSPLHHSGPASIRLPTRRMPRQPVTPPSHGTKRRMPDEPSPQQSMGQSMPSRVVSQPVRRLAPAGEEPVAKKRTCYVPAQLHEGS